jgi:predicted Zn-dependent protease
VETYETLLSYVSDPALRHHIQGLIQAHQGNFETAIAELRRAAVISPGESAHWHTLGIVHLHADQDENAFESFQTGLRLSPNDTASLTYSCDALMRLNRPMEAMRRLGSKESRRSALPTSVDVWVRGRAHTTDSPQDGKLGARRGRRAGIGRLLLHCARGVGGGN